MSFPFILEHAVKFLACAVTLECVCECVFIFISLMGLVMCVCGLVLVCFFFFLRVLFNGTQLYLSHNAARRKPSV